MSCDVCSYSRPSRPSPLQSHLSEMATASKRKRSSYDAAFKLRIIESAENSNNYAAGRQFGVPTPYTRVDDFGQHMDSISRGVGGDLYVGTTYRRVYMVITVLMVVD